ncbi:MAG: hypothetical protein SYR96_01490 [Actinomycetota bacterium]|nr:hypothetical protein [Actinomycetota bacterium]
MRVAHFCGSFSGRPADVVHAHATGPIGMAGFQVAVDGLTATETYTPALHLDRLRKLYEAVGK